MAETTEAPPSVELRKVGSGFDLPIAAAMVGECIQIWFASNEIVYYRGVVERHVRQR